MDNRFTNDEITKERAVMPRRNFLCECQIQDNTKKLT